MAKANLDDDTFDKLFDARERVRNARSYPMDPSARNGLDAALVLINEIIKAAGGRP